MKQFFVGQSLYAKQLFKHFGMQNCNPVSTPLPVNSETEPKREMEAALTARDHLKYRSLLGGRAYLAGYTRPDLKFSKSALSWSLYALMQRHLSLAKWLCRYSARTLNYGLSLATLMPFSPNRVRAAVDADWGGCQETRKFTTRYDNAINLTPVYRKPKKQAIVSLSSGEAEYFFFWNAEKQLLESRNRYLGLFNNQCGMVTSRPLQH